MTKLPGINLASRVLAAQGANVVFYRRAPYRHEVLRSEVSRQGTVYGFRRGTMAVEVPREFIKGLLDQGLGNGEILFSLRPANDQRQIRNAFRMAVGDRIPIDQAFASQGMIARGEFLKGLLIAAYGAISDLLVIDPQYGVENLNYFLLRETDFVDSRVFNPNLGGLGKLRHLLETEEFAFVGLSPIVLNKDVEVMSLVGSLGRSALKIAGGSTFDSVPPEIFLRSFPLDVVVRGPGEKVMLKIAELLREDRRTVLDRLQGITNVWTWKEGTVFPPADLVEASVGSLSPRQDDVPLQGEDIYHQTSYLAFRWREGIAQGDHIGLKPITVMLTDNCRSKCLFCVTPKNKMRTARKERLRIVARVVEQIKQKWAETRDGRPVHDAVQIIDNNFTTHREMLEEFCRSIIREGLADIPKSCKGRVDEFCLDRKSSQPDRELIRLMARAGFKRIYFGNESFTQKALDSMHKGITVEQNENVLRAVIAEGITPGINLIMFGGLEDAPRDVLHTAERALYYVGQGATVNVVDFMGASHDSPVMKVFPERISYSTWEAPGMRAPYREPDVVFTNSELHSFGKAALAKKDDFIRFLRYQYPFQTFSTHVDSLALFWAIARLMKDDGLAEKAEWLIDEHIVAQTGNVLPYEKVPNPDIRNMRHAFVDGDFGETINHYNHYLEQLYQSNPGKFELHAVSVGDLLIDPLQEVADIPQMALAVSRVVREMEARLRRPLRIRLAGYPATGKTMLRNQLVKEGLEFEMLNLDRCRTLLPERVKGDVWQTSENLESYYDLARLADHLRVIPEDRRVLYEGTWVLAPEFSLSSNWDLSIAFDFPAETWRRSLWFRQILFRRKGLDALLPSPEQMKLYDLTYLKYVSRLLGEADLVVGEDGEILRVSRKVGRILEKMGTGRFNASFFIDQLKYF